jgi:hypothetical protein
VLDEKTLRKPGFSEGYKVKLADGQEWTFPKPRLLLKPKFVNGRIDVSSGPSFGPNYDTALDIALGAVEVEPEEWMRTKFDAAVRLLRANYELSDTDVVELLTFEMGNPLDDERWTELCRITVGIAPKLSPAT